ncbi:MAG: SufS family cysteine desulfurase [Treponemataceae bacterium]|nr:SufS family cysteine desulfurase [Treponemataceae bacterium]
MRGHIDTDLPQETVPKRKGETVPASFFLEERSKEAQQVRQDFPLLAGNPNLAYLDNAATTQKPAVVLEREANFYRETCANVHRAIYRLGEEATARYEEARRRLASFIGAQPEEVVFTRGCTEGLNLLAHSLGELLLPGDEIILSEMEHHANIVPWQLLSQRKGIHLRFIPITDEGLLDLTTYEELLSPRTRLVSVTAVSNVLGTVNPVRWMAEKAHQRGALFAVDAAQAVPMMKIDIPSLGTDFLVFSGHKMYGPFGIGVLYGKKELLEKLPPFLGGGDMIREVHLEGFTPAEIPYKFEAGTPPISQAVALAAAVEWLEQHNPDRLGQYETLLGKRLYEGLQTIPGVRILGPDYSSLYSSSFKRAGIVSFTLEGIHAHDLSAYLDKKGFALRAGHHCAHPLAQRFGVVSSLRASFGAYNTLEEVDTLLEAIHTAQKEL